jgi:hypothetical protein
MTIKFFKNNNFIAPVLVLLTPNSAAVIPMHRSESHHPRCQICEVHDENMDVIVIIFTYQNTTYYYTMHQNKE